ncbi:heparinase II/III domain-containing protein [Negadavirga shengliensis]|uniref:Heparinase II/III family protein n=1 Tax=Negadavirga shengliensis TaxID=1389218 RepID=A0ABV9SXC8_9BACT
MNYQIIRFVVLGILLQLSIFTHGQNIPKQLPVTEHPRLLLMKGEENEIKGLISKDKQWYKLHEAIINEADRLDDEGLLERKQIGRRLLSVSREALRRIFHLSYAYRLTGEQKYVERAEKEMLTIAGFSDWNPTHFLDVAEMTMALAIGYDWMYDALSLDTRKTISNAIVKHGLEPSYNEDYNWFLKATHNWNQVCNAGMVFGAFAIYEDQPKLAQKTIERAIKTIPLAMEDYKPDGAYPEGYGYWGYGTTFNVLFLDAVENIYGTDFGLSEIQGFMETAGFYKNMTGVTGLSYNWGDAGGGYGSLTPAMFWFAQKSQSPSLLWVEKHHLDAADLSRLTRNRVLPAAMVWGRNTSLNGIPAPTRKVWVGQGPNPVALIRTSWTDPDAIYLGFKAGSASVNHGHMDIGSFIMEADGVRWAMDFGSQNYESLESKGIQLFGRTQDAQRWTVFRLNNFVHNTLTIDGAHQRVEGYAKIDRFGDSDSFPFAISNITETYEGQAKNITRGVGIVDGRYVLVRDEIKANSSPSTIRWNMLTPAEVTIENDRAVLTKDGKKLYLMAQGGKGVKWKTWSTEPATDYDEPNPGTIMVGFEYEASGDEDFALQVVLVPEKALEKVKKHGRNLKNWK